MGWLAGVQRGLFPRRQNAPRSSRNAQHPDCWRDCLTLVDGHRVDHPQAPLCPRHHLRLDRWARDHHAWRWLRRPYWRLRLRLPRWALLLLLCSDEAPLRLRRRARRLWHPRPRGGTWRHSNGAAGYRRCFKRSERRVLWRRVEDPRAADLRDRGVHTVVVRHDLPSPQGDRDADRPPCKYGGGEWVGHAVPWGKHHALPLEHERAPLLGRRETHRRSQLSACEL
mmetsp:Transcript_17537/g.42558  ORF Transcript_17537/g.42558 Transcript_17537/m.42558 type:complete len:225 (+) Transcript_17537:1266-1940(+)